jgi:hypothetical protein
MSKCRVLQFFCPSAEKGKGSHTRVAAQMALSTIVPESVNEDVRRRGHDMTCQLSLDYGIFGEDHAVLESKI